MGANHFGEVEYMVHIAKPDVALVNNAGPAHLEGFGDISGVARAKGEIYSGLGPQGIAVINADDSKADVWRSLCADKSTRTFALDTSADVAGVWSALDHELVINTEGESVAVQLNLLGRHNALNALAASTSALALGAGLAAVKAGLESVQAVDGRLKLLTPRSDLQLIDDSYNANPASLLAGAQVAVDMDQSEAWLVLGDLGELGGDVAQVHANLGGQLKQQGIDRLFTLGSYSAHTARVFNEGAASFDSINELLNAVNQALAEAEGTITVLVKGSRSSRMERVVQALAPNETTGDQ
jgi:UDP-N-acetylmuramoyl-tripeptide--D-alanyl-D-alanine ligase